MAQEVERTTSGTHLSPHHRLCPTVTVSADILGLTQKHRTLHNVFVLAAECIIMQNIYIGYNFYCINAKRVWALV